MTSTFDDPIIEGDGSAEKAEEFKLLRKSGSRSIRKPAGASVLIRARRTLKETCRTFKKMWDVWVRFKKNPVLSTPKTSQTVESTFDTPGFEEIACIEVEVPDIMVMDMDKIRTSCKGIPVPKFPAREQIEKKLLAADKYYRVSEGEYTSRPSWRFILDRPLVEQYVLMNNYIRKISIMSELRGEKLPAEVAEEDTAEADEAYRKFARRHNKQTRRLHSSIARQHAMMDAGVQTFQKGTVSELSLYPNSDMSSEIPTTSKQQASSPMAFDVEDKLPIAATELTSDSGTNWWISDERPQISEAFPTSSDSMGKIASGSGSEGLSVPVHSTAGGTSLAQLAEGQGTTTENLKKVTFASEVKCYTDSMSIGAHSYPLSQLSTNVPLHANIKKYRFEHDQSLTSVRTSSARDTTDGSSSTSNDRIALRASPAVVFQPGLAAPLNEQFAVHTALEESQSPSLAQLEVVRCEVGRKQVVLLSPEDKVTLVRRRVDEVSPIRRSTLRTPERPGKSSVILNQPDKTVLAARGETHATEKETRHFNIYPTAQLHAETDTNKEYLVQNQRPHLSSLSEPGQDSNNVPIAGSTEGPISGRSIDPITGLTIEQDGSLIDNQIPGQVPQLPSSAMSIVELKNIFENKCTTSGGQLRLQRVEPTIADETQKIQFPEGQTNIPTSPSSNKKTISQHGNHT